MAQLKRSMSQWLIPAATVNLGDNHVADAASLKFIGFLLGSVTLAVILMAVTLVSGSVASSSDMDRQQFGYAQVE